MIEISHSAQRPRFIVQTLRVGVFLLLFCLALFFHLSQSTFFSWDFYWQFYLISFLGLLLNLLGVIFLKAYFLRPQLLLCSFCLDVILISFLLLRSELNVSLFMFLYLIEILLMALVFRTKGALLLAAVSSLCFSFVSLLGPEMKALTFFYNLFLYNIAFFVVAWISGMLSDQLEFQGLSLNQLRLLNESIIESMPSGLLSMTKDGFIIMANPGVNSIFKLDEIEGQNIFQFIPEFKKLFEIWMRTEKNIKNQSFQQEIPFQRDSDNLILRIQALSHETENSDFLLILEDVTEVRRLELMILHQQKLAAIGGLASGIAHELGNPLAAISANMQYLEPKIKIEDETDKKLISNTHREISRLGRLIGEFKDFAKPEKIPVESVILSSVLKQVLEIVQSDRSLRSDIRLHTDLEDTVEVRGSRDKLVQAFLNVVVNAYHALSSVENPELQISVKVIGLNVIVRIHDNGTGMNEETKQRLFEPFYTTKGRNGTGLGLAVTYKILQAHQAVVSVESKKGQGTEFIIKFPIKIDSGKS